MSTAKEREVILEILEMYKHMPCLWDKNHPDYKNKIKRTYANDMLFDLYKQLDSNANLPTFNKKIQNLRTNYYKEERKVKLLQATDANIGETYKPTLWYYDALSFLSNESNECSQSADTFRPETISPSTSDGEESYQISETGSSPDIKRRKFTNPVVYKNTNNGNVDTETASEKAHMNNEEWEIFGKAIGLQLRDLDKKQLTIAQKNISDIIYYAKFGLLTTQTYINLGTPPS